MSETRFKPITAITMGDPAGIGPETVVETMLEKEIHELLQTVCNRKCRNYGKSS